MGERTTYAVALDYDVRGNAARELGNIGAKASEAQHSTMGLKSALLAVGGYFGLREAKAVFIDYNAEIESAKIGMAGMAQISLGGTFAEAQKGAEGLVTEFQRFATQTPLTTMELVQFGQSVQMAVMGAGGKMSDFTTVAEQGAVAAKAFGVSADTAGMQISEMMSGQVRKTERFAQMLVHMMGVTDEQWNKMTGGERLSRLEKVLGHPALKNMETAYASSFAGVTSTLKDNIQIALGKVGLPLFKAISAEIGKWNDWMAKHPQELERIGKSLASALVSGFNAIKSIVGFIIDNKTMLMGIAAVWAGRSILGGAGGMAMSALGSGETELLGMFRPQAAETAEALAKVAKEGTSVTSSLSTFGGGLMTAISGLSLVYVGAQGFADWINGKIDEWNSKIVSADFGGFGRSEIDAYIKNSSADAMSYTPMDQQYRGADKNILSLAHIMKDAGALTFAQDETGASRVQYNRDKIRASLAADPAFHAGENTTDLAGRLLAEEKNKEALVKYTNALDAAAADLANRPDLLKRFMPGFAPPTDPDKAIKPAPTNITIQRIEVASDDPDRFVFGMVRAVETARKSPGQARDALGNL